MMFPWNNHWIYAWCRKKNLKIKCFDRLHLHLIFLLADLAFALTPSSLLYVRLHEHNMPFSSTNNNYIALIKCTLTCTVLYRAPSIKSVFWEKVEKISMVYYTPLSFLNQLQQLILRIFNLKFTSFNLVLSSHFGVLLLLLLDTTCDISVTRVCKSSSGKLRRAENPQFNRQSQLFSKLVC